MAFLFLLAGNGSFSTSNSPAELRKPEQTTENHLVELKLSFAYFDQPKPAENHRVGFQHPHAHNMVYQNPLIISCGKVSVEQLSDFLWNHNKGIHRNYAFQIADLYVKEAMAEGVNHDIAFCQMCLETGFLRYGGVVRPEQFNFCGLGAVSDFEEGLYFESPAEGIRAHIQHLKAYASEDSLRRTLIDKRFNYVKRGSAYVIDQLTGKWATDPKYGKKIRYLLRRLHLFV
ncbi:MAG: glucosaminidase domain-containing protein [Bacteroidales bacterium]|nr:glucosaminidase domain-containing protein [Bacteroidales bacterium]MCF8351646.1 glucosaminidase domain-containing protein [Bacteroidales bacterium]MCF8376137.1 glucosaminidase domain-containing protein [Bacteroidales bacterium]